MIACLIRGTAASILLTLALAECFGDDRQPAGGISSPRVAQVDAKSTPKAPDEASHRREPQPFSLAFVPHDAIVVAAARPAELLRRPTLAVLRRDLSEYPQIDKMLGIAFERIDSLVLVIVPDASPEHPNVNIPARAGLIFHFNDPADSSELMTALVPNPQSEFNGVPYICSPGGSPPFCFIHKERTVVVSDSEAHLMRLVDASPAASSTATWAKDWQEVSQADGAVLVNSFAIGEWLDRDLSALRSSRPDPLVAFAPLWRSTRGGSITLALDDVATIRGRISTMRPEASRSVKSTIEAALTLGKNLLPWVQERSWVLGRADRGLMLALTNIALGRDRTIRRSGSTDSIVKGR
jgi:hypothetical protein